jgi:hypothetical protein
VLDAGKLECLVSPNDFFRINKPVTRSFVDTLPLNLAWGAMD